MRLWLETVAVALSMFSAIPMPVFEWNSKNLRYTLCAFPLTGVFVGGGCWLWALLCSTLGLPDLLRGALLTAIPVWITGGIHLDGYADTCDARASHGSPEKKRAILKDPHIGTFAVIHLIVWFCLWFTFCTVWNEWNGCLMMLVFMLSRCLSGLAVASFPMAADTGLAHTFATAADKSRVRVVLLVLTGAVFAAMMGTGGLQGAAAGAAGLLVFGYYKRVAMKEFGGISGDLAGWFLQTAELWMLAAACAVWMGEKLL